MDVSADPRPDGEPLIDRLEALRRSALRQQADLGARLAEVEARLGSTVGTGSAHARITLDDRGFPIGLDLSVDGRATADQIRAALVSALVGTRTATTLLPADAVARVIGAVEEAAAAPDGPAAALAAQSVAVTNDLGRATVTGLYGDIVGVEVHDSWTTAARPETLADEILTLAQRAARASDRFGRFTDEEDAHG